MDKAQTIKKAAELLTKELADRGKILEGGWQAYLVVEQLNDAPADLKEALRRAYYSGAQHLIGSIMTMLEAGTEATDADLDRMMGISNELEAFIKERKAQQN